MSYTPTTIKNIVNKINLSIFLPSMQRDFVWKSEQIINLFDSLLMKYPTGTMLFWNIDDQQCAEMNRYHFVNTVMDGGGNPITRAPPIARGDLTFVLDGQQRLTSLYVGLLGNINTGGNLNKLYLNLLHNTSLKNEDDVNFYSKYLSFRNSAGYAAGEYWFRVGDILEINDDEEFKKKTDQLTQGIAGWVALTPVIEELIKTNLTKLYNAICIDNNLNYFTEKNRDEERILDIFVRINSGGTSLSKSDLLLSTLTLHWDGIGDKPPKYLVSELASTLRHELIIREAKLGKDFIMKACLMLTDMPIAYKISSFTLSNCQTIGRSWQAIAIALNKTARITKEFGITRGALVSANALLPVAYFFYKNPAIDVDQERNRIDAVFNDIRRWLIMAMINGVLGGSSDSMLSGLRQVISGTTDMQFPINNLDNFVRSNNRITTFDPRGIDNILKLKHGDDLCLLALSLIYDEKWIGVTTVSIDHLVTKKQIKDNYSNAYLKEQGNSIANLTLVHAADNNARGEIILKNWIDRQSNDYISKHLIPSEITLWNINEYSNFINQRATLIRNKLESILR